MAQNSYPPACRALIDQYAPLAGRLAAASGLTLDDLRQEIAVAWLAGQDPARAVPAALGLRHLPGGAWLGQDLHLAARLANLPDGFEATALPAPVQARGHLTAAIAVDCGVGLRSAQKRLKRQREAAAQGQGDLFGVCV